MQAPSRTRQCLGTGVGRGFRATGWGSLQHGDPLPRDSGVGAVLNGLGAAWAQSAGAAPHVSPTPTKPLTLSARSAPLLGQRGRTCLHPPPGSLSLGRGPPAWGLGLTCPACGTGVRPPGGAREAGPKLRSQGPRRPRCGHRTPHRCPKTPFVGARLEQRAREAGAGGGPGGRGWAPRPRGRAEHSPGAGPLPAARGGLGWGARLVQVSGPRTPPPLPVNYAGGWHWRARVAQVSLATFARASLLPAAGQLRPRSRWPGRLRRVVRTGAPGGANRALAT